MQVGTILNSYQSRVCVSDSERLQVWFQTTAVK